MTEEEKENNPNAELMEWYLRTYEVSKNLHKEWKTSFDKASKEDVEKTLSLPNFSYEIFEEITGITKEDFERKLWKIENLSWKVAKVTIDVKEYDAVIQ